MSSRILPAVRVLLVSLAIFLGYRFISMTLSDTTKVQGATISPEPKRLSPGVNAANVQLIGHAGGALLGVTVRDGLIYVGEGSSISILGPAITNTLNVVGTTGLLPGVITDLQIAGDKLYATAGDAGLFLLELASTASLTETGFLDTPGYAASLSISGTLVVVADGIDGLRVVDSSNPALLNEIGFIDTTGYAASVVISGTNAFLADGDAGLRVISLADPAHPQEIGSLDTPGQAERVVLNGHIAYVADHTSLRVVDISAPVSPLEIGHFNAPGTIIGVSAAQDRAFVAVEETGLTILDTSIPSSPDEIGNYPFSNGLTERLFVTGSTALLTNTFFGLVMLDISSPANIIEVAHYQPSRYANHVTAAGNWAYVGDQYAGLRILDLGNPTHPGLAGTFPGPGPVYGSTVRDNLAYLAAGSYGMRVVDVADPGNSTEIGMYDSPGFTRDITLAGHYAFIADGTSGLRVVDISDPAQPLEAGFYDTPGYAQEVAVYDDYAFIADGDNLQIVDVFFKGAPSGIGSISAPGTATAVALDGYKAFVIFGAGMQTLDVSNPANPIPLGWYPAPQWLTDVTIVGNLAYVTDQYAGLRVVDVSDMAHPVELGYFDTPDFARSVVVNQGTIYIADSQGGTLLLRFAPAASHPVQLPLLIRNSPLAYTISGKVTDPGLIPMPGVLVQSSDGQSVYTSTGGEFLLISLPSGTYTVTPLLDGYTFNPSWRNVNVPPDASNQDFIAEAVQTPTPPPVTCREILVNGSFESATGWEILGSSFPADYSTEQIHTGTRAMRTGITNPAQNRTSFSSARQTVSLPAMIQSASLRFWLYLQSGEASNALNLPVDLSLGRPMASEVSDYQSVRVLDLNNQVLETLVTQLSNSQSWTPYEFSLTAYSGQSIKILLTTYNNGTGGVSAMFVDDASLDMCTNP